MNREITDPELVMMKRKKSIRAAMIVSAVLIVGVLLAVFGARSATRTMDYIIAHKPHFSGVVTETHENSILVKAAEGEDIRKSADLINVSLSVENQDSVREFSVGDAVTVYYDGSVAESYPAQVGKVYAILLSERANAEESRGLDEQPANSASSEVYSAAPDDRPVSASAFNLPTVAIYEAIPGDDYLASFPVRNSADPDDYTRLTPDAETGWILLNDTVTVAATLPAGTVSFDFYYASAGTEREGVRFAEGGFDKLTEQRTVLGDFAAAEWFPDGFHGHIWVVTADAEGVEHHSEIVNANYVPRNRSDVFTSAELRAAMAAVREKFKDFGACTMTDLWYDEKKSIPYTAEYMADAGRDKDGGDGNAILLYSNFDVDNSGGDGSLTPGGSYTNWKWLLVRDGADGDWRVVDWGY